MKSRGVSKYMFISSMITPFSRSISSASNLERRSLATRQAIAAQPDWLRAVPTDRRFPDGARVLLTGCGTSFHAAQTGGEAVQALELVLRPRRDADLLVALSHEGGTALTVEAARAFDGPV